MIKIKRSENTNTNRIITQFNQNLQNNLSGYTKLSKCPEVILAVDRIADLISNMTIHLMHNTSNGDQVVKNGLYRAVDINPCEGMTRKQFMQFIVRTLLLDGDGNAVVIPKFTEDGLIKDLIPVPASHFSIRTSSDFRDGYKIQIDNKEYNPDSLIHFVLNPSFENPYKGQSYRIQLKDIVKTLKAGVDTKQEFLSGRYMPSLIIRIDGDDEELLSNEGKNRIYNKYIGSQRAGAPWIVPEGVVTDIKEITPLSLKDIAINDSIEAEKELVAALLGIPAFMLGIGEFNKTEYNNFIKDKILSIAKTIEQTLTQALLTSEDYYFKFNIRSLYSYDLTTLSNVGATLFNQGILTGNEVRDWIGLSPKEGLDDLKILENYIPIEDSGKQKKLVGNEDD